MAPSLSRRALRGQRFASRCPDIVPMPLGMSGQRRAHETGSSSHLSRCPDIFMNLYTRARAELLSDPKPIGTSGHRDRSRVSHRPSWRNGALPRTTAHASARAKRRAP